MRDPKNQEEIESCCNQSGSLESSHPNEEWPHVNLFQMPLSSSIDLQPRCKTCETLQNHWQVN